MCKKNQIFTIFRGQIQKKRSFGPVLDQNFGQKLAQQLPLKTRLRQKQNLKIMLQKYLSWVFRGTCWARFGSKFWSKTGPKDLFFILILNCLRHRAACVAAFSTTGHVATGEGPQDGIFAHAGGTRGFGTWSCRRDVGFFFCPVRRCLLGVGLLLRSGLIRRRFCIRAFFSVGTSTARWGVEVVEFMFKDVFCPVFERLALVSWFRVHLDYHDYDYGDYNSDD